MTRSFNVFFDLRLNKRLSKQSWGWWFETLSHPLWRHCNGLLLYNIHYHLMRWPSYGSRYIPKGWQFVNQITKAIFLMVDYQPIIVGLLGIMMLIISLHHPLSPATTYGIYIRVTLINANSFTLYILNTVEEVWLHMSLFSWFLNTELAQIIKIISRGRQEPIYFI